MTKELTYLALGDSYTIGEQVPATESFPMQVAARLKGAGLPLAMPAVIAKTGWTTGELQEAIDKAVITDTYDMVTLLIGVNNQYRGYHIDDYRKDFAALLEQAIGFAGQHTSRVLVLSIPDWGVTPYASGRDRTIIAQEIDAYNEINRALTQKAGVNYIDITPGTREAASDESLLTGDGLHPSGKEYARWAEKVARYYEILFRK
ncbi:MAG: SGNH/GDSL hydrolase family protein [Chitinophagaceae bacterium]|nr:SGNH/GDSL hydrolase family protein [Chitinophagaceae bacterium]